MVAPADLRYLRQAAPNIAGDSVTGRVITFLETLYNSVAETLPDSRDLECDSIETNLTSVADVSTSDPYAAALTEEGMPHQNAKSSSRKDRPLKSVKFDRGKLVEKEERWLPPGASMRDYWEQMLDSEGVDASDKKHPHGVSFAQFWRVLCPKFCQIVER